MAVYNISKRLVKRLPEKIIARGVYHNNHYNLLGMPYRLALSMFIVFGSITLATADFR